MKTSNTSIFIEKAIAVHGDKYDYSQANYVHNKEKLVIICKVAGHGFFLQSPNKHLRNRGCPRCGGKIKSNSVDFIQKAMSIHGNTYDYSYINYINVKAKVRIICREEGHGEFLQTPGHHLNGAGCPKCCGKLKSNTEEFIKKAKLIHGNTYNYDNVIYVDAFKKIKIICKKCNVSFLQSPYKHLQNQGCAACKLSHGEMKIKNVLEALSLKYEMQKTFKNCKNINLLPFDFYLPDYNICIEYDGEQHSKFGNLYTKTKSDLDNRKKIDKIKTTYCETNNIELLRIDYSQFNNIKKVITTRFKY